MENLQNFKKTFLGIFTKCIRKNPKRRISIDEVIASLNDLKLKLWSYIDFV